MSQIEDSWLSDLELEEFYSRFLKTFSKYLMYKPKIHAFIIFYQLLYLWEHERDNLMSLVTRAEYDIYKGRIDANLHLLNTTGQMIQTTEKNGELILEFPKAETISNGQKDVLTFAAELMIFKASINKDKKYLLSIDNVLWLRHIS